jgi:hypothetical protein
MPAGKLDKPEVASLSDFVGRRTPAEINQNMNNNLLKNTT